MLISQISGTIPEGLIEPVIIKPKVNKAMWGKGWPKVYNPNDPWAPLTSMLWNQWNPFPFAKGGMKGKGKGWGGKPWGGGGLSSFPAEKKVWIGNLPEGVTYQQLLDHFGGPGKAKYAIAMKGKGLGTGGAAFATAEEATEAIQRLNGSVLNGVTIVVDVWTKKSDSVGETL